MELRLIYIWVYLGLSPFILEICSAQNNPGTGNSCSTDRIEKGATALGGCQCSAGKEKEPKCQKCPLTECNVPGLLSVSRLATCNQGCIDANHPCDNCFLWFDSVCNCQKHGNCPTFNLNPEWVRIASGKLISTTKKTPGVLQLQSEAPWQYGQRDLDRPNKALTINSVKTRTQEQIHIHVCPVKEIVQRILASQKYTDFQDMGPIKMPVADPNPWLCKVNPTKGQTISGVTADLQNQIKKAKCKDFIGAAVVVDSNDRAWACVTTDDQPTQYTFCHRDPPG
jgi:hypothetical protein